MILLVSTIPLPLIFFLLHQPMLFCITWDCPQLSLIFCSNYIAGLRIRIQWQSRIDIFGLGIRTLTFHIGRIRMWHHRIEVLTIMLTQNTLRTSEGNRVFFKFDSKFATAADLNKCLEQNILSISLCKCVLFLRYRLI